MKFIVKTINTIFVIGCLLFFSGPISRWVSWNASDVFRKDKSMVSEGSAFIGAVAGSLTYGILMVIALWLLKGIWRKSTKKEGMKDKDVTADDFRDAVEPQEGFTNSGLKIPSIKICPYCAETIKYKAIKCKHCQSDLKNLPSE